jgi:hypothetical protein
MDRLVEGLTVLIHTSLVQLAQDTLELLLHRLGLLLKLLVLEPTLLLDLRLLGSRNSSKVTVRRLRPT